jgi:hypothetical protein
MCRSQQQQQQQQIDGGDHDDYDDVRKKQSYHGTLAQRLFTRITTFVGYLVTTTTRRFTKLMFSPPA